MPCSYSILRNPRRRCVWPAIPPCIRRLRFVAVAGCTAAAEFELLRTLDKGIVPDDINFCGANYEAELVRDVLRRLIDNLTQPLPTRRNPRRNINVNLKVANGFFKMLEQTDVGLNFSQDDGETWEVEDISVTGFRSVLPSSRADGIKIGSLVGSKPENVPHWGAGIVRRLSRDEKNNLHVGVEVLSTQIVGISLTDRVYPADDETQVALVPEQAQRYERRGVAADEAGHLLAQPQPEHGYGRQKLSVVAAGAGGEW